LFHPVILSSPAESLGDDAGSRYNPTGQFCDTFLNSVAGHLEIASSLVGLLLT